MQYDLPECYSDVRICCLNETLKHPLGSLYYVLFEEWVGLHGHQIDEVLDGYNEILDVGDFLGSSRQLKQYLQSILQ